MMKNEYIQSEAAKSSAAEILKGAEVPVSESLQMILQYINDSEDRYPEAADYMKEVLACLCDQITPEQALG
jgi:hypothetical protein